MGTRAKDLRRGNVVLRGATPFKVIEQFHNTPGKGRATVWLKLRNLLNGTQTEVTLGSVEDVEIADIFTFQATYLYHDAEGYHFMNSESYDQIAISDQVMGDSAYYLQEEMKVHVTTFNDEPIGVELPTTVVLTIVETEPELKGATVTHSQKPAKTETGLQLTVPPFVKEGDKIIVNTEEGTYISRAD